MARQLYTTSDVLELLEEDELQPLEEMCEGSDEEFSMDEQDDNEEEMDEQLNENGLEREIVDDVHDHEEEDNEEEMEEQLNENEIEREVDDEQGLEIEVDDEACGSTAMERSNEHVLEGDDVVTFTTTAKKGKKSVQYFVFVT